MKRCEMCSQPFPARIKLEGKVHNLQSRRYCLTCSPFRAHNTSRLEERLTEEGRQKKAKEVRRAKYRKYQRKARRERKRLLIEALGGCCQICGYNESCPGAYSFHHVDRATKRFSLS